MTATKRLSDVAGFKPGWTLTVNGVPVEGDWEAVSRFGSVETAVVMNADGTPSYDRPVYREAPNVNLVAWGLGKDGKARFAVIRQPRPHSDDPEESGNDHSPVVFGQIPMGFLEKVIGKDDLSAYEDVRTGAARETLEETGALVVVDITQPQYPYCNPAPSFVATWSDILFVQVNLNVIAELQQSRDEPIFSAEYVTAEELRRRIAEGKDEEGAVYRSGHSLAALMIFFSTYPQYW